MYFDTGAYIIGSVLGLLVAAGLGLIPANIAKQKGYDFRLWWFYGFMLFIVAIIHISLLPDKNETAKSNSQSAAEELKKYKELLDQDVITEEEFNCKKEQLLKLI